LIGGSGFVGDFLGDPRDSLDGGDCGIERIFAEEADFGEEEANIFVNEDAALDWMGSWGRSAFGKFGHGSTPLCD
jgi:hypothetical protein